MAIRLSENFRALFYAPFYAAHAIGAYRSEGVEVTLLSSPDPERTAAALRAGDVDVMWGGPLRGDADARTGSGGRQRVLLRRHRARSVLRHRPRAAAGFPGCRSRRPPLRLGRRSADAVAVPAGRPAPRRRRSRAAEPHQRSDHGRECGRVARRFAGCGAAVPTVCRGADRIRRRPCLVCRRGSRPHRLHGAGDASAAARYATRRTARDDAGHDAHLALDGATRRAAISPARWRISSPLWRLVSLQPQSTATVRSNSLRPILCCSVRDLTGCRPPCAPAGRSTAPSPLRSASTTRSRGRRLPPAEPTTRNLAKSALQQGNKGRLRMHRRKILTGLGAVVLAGGQARAPEKPRWMSPLLPDGTRDEATLETLPGKQKLIRLADRPPNYESADRDVSQCGHAERSVLRPLSSGCHSADGRSRQMVSHCRR